VTCQQTLRAEGKAYPRTCQECGLGPCKEVRAPDPATAEIEKLKSVVEGGILVVTRLNARLAEQDALLADVEEVLSSVSGIYDGSYEHLPHWRRPWLNSRRVRFAGVNS
jgi:hypothetical protein